MKKKDCFTGLGMTVFNRVALHGYVYIGSRKYFALSLAHLHRQQVEVVTFRDDDEKVSVFIDGDLAAVATRVSESSQRFPSEPLVRDAFERIFHRSLRILRGLNHG